MSLPAAQFRKKYHVSHLSILGIVSMLCPWAKPQPSNTSLDSGENEYLVGQRWRFV